MDKRILHILTIAGIVVISLGGCSSASRSDVHASNSTPTLHPSLAPSTSQAPRVGDSAPDFALSTLDGTRTVHLSDFRGQAVLLNFWTITCSTCVKEQSTLQRFYAQQQAVGKQMAVLGVDLDQVNNFVNVATLQQSLGLTYPILVDDHFQVRISYQITNVPLAYFLDRQHIIRSIVAGPLDETELHKEVNCLMSTPPSPCF